MSGSLVLNIIFFVVVILASIGAINTMSAEVFNHNIISQIYGRGKSTGKKVTYAIIGVSALIAILMSILIVSRNGFKYNYSKY